MVAAHVARAQAREATELERDEPPVVAEQLVAAGAGEPDLHVSAHEAEDVPRRKAAAVRLVERPHHREEVVEQLACVDHELVVLGPVASASARASGSSFSSSSSSDVNPSEYVCRSEWPDSASKPTIALESSPPESEHAIGTSARLQRETASASAARSRSTHASRSAAVVRLEREPVPAASLGLARLEVDLERMARRQALDTREDRVPSGDEAERQVVPEARRGRGRGRFRERAAMLRAPMRARALRRADGRSREA